MLLNGGVGLEIWAFVDFENVGSLEKLEFKKYQRILVFCGANNTRINIGNKEITSFVSMEVLRVKTTGANNLDFHLTYYLGKMSDEAGKNVEFEVVSKDKGFDGLIEHLCQTGRICRRVDGTKQAKKINTTKKCDSVFVQIVKRLSSTDGNNLPKKKTKLENWIVAQCNGIKGAKSSKKIFNELLTQKIIKTNGNNIVYLM